MPKKTVKQVYMVQCAYDETHRFEKVFEIEQGTELRVTEIETYCPHCNKKVTVAVMGQVVPDEVYLRGFTRQ